MLAAFKFLGAIDQMMRSVIGKFWALYLVGVIVQLAVVVVVLLRFFAPTNSMARYALNAIFDRTAILGGPVVFNFIIEWAEVLSITAVYIIVIPTLISVMENHRQQTLARVYIWAMDAILELTKSNNEESIVKQLDDWEKRLHNIIVKSNNALSNTRAIGNGLKPKIEKAVANLLKLENCFNNHTKPTDIKALLQTTVIALKEISTSTYNSFYHSR